MKKMIRYVSIPALLALSSCSALKPTAPQISSAEKIIIHSDTVARVNNLRLSVGDSLLIRYALYLRTDQKVMTNIRLYSFIDKWLRTPYKWGGTDEKGIDCSAFIQRLLSEVYNANIPRTSVQQFFNEGIEPFSSKKALAEGDLVFFQTLDNTVISHVGLYLQNNMFVNSCSSKGVSIACLDDPYWKKHYVAAGRIRNGYFTAKR